VDKPVSAWIAVLRARTGIKPPAAPLPGVTPDAGAPAGVPEATAAADHGDST
jgi:hypothetical protein